MAVTTDRRPLATGYYLDNFEILLAETASGYADFLRGDDRRFVTAFRELPLDARRLYVRLLARKGPWFRRDRLGYREIDCETAIVALQDRGFARAAGAAETAARLALLSLAELHALLDDPAGRIDGVFRRATRAALRGELELAVGDAAESLDMATRVPLIGLEHLETVRRLQLLFFGNLRQDLSDFVLADLGVVRFEKAALGGRSFPNSDAVDEHLRLFDASAAVLGASGEDRETLLPGAAATGLAASHPVNQRLRDALVNLVARERERAGRLEEALALFASATAPPARERRVRILSRLGRRAEAATLRREMAAAPRDESERIMAERGPRGRRRAAPPSRTVEIAPGSPGESIEARALKALTAEGYRGFFAENWLWRSLFGLAFWDIVFAPIDGAFVHRFQYGPRDLYEGFRDAREELVTARLDALVADPRPAARLLDQWDRKFGTVNRLVAFAPELRGHLELALSRLSGAQIAAVSDRLSRDLRRYGSGLPDLFLLDRHGGILLAEVKGPGDIVRPEQESWIEYLNVHDLPTVVLRVSDPRAPATEGR